MRKPDPNAESRIETYIDEAKPFARPILATLRDLIVASHPETRPDWKWRAPAYVRRGILCMTWSFKKHATLTFPRGQEIDDWAKAFDPQNTQVEHSRRIVFTDAAQIDPKVVTDYTLQAIAIDETGLPPKTKPIPVEVSDLLAEALKKEPEVKTFFDSLAPGYRRDYCRYVSEAKQEATKIRRLERAMARLRAGEKRVMM